MLLFPSRAHGLEVHRSFSHISSKRIPSLGIKFGKRNRKDYVFRRLNGKKKRMITTFESHTAQYLETDNMLEQLVRQTECEIMKAEYQSEETVHEFLTWDESHSKRALKEQVLYLRKVAKGKCCNNLFHFLKILPPYLAKITTNYCTLDNIKKVHQSCAEKIAVEI